MSTKNFVSSGDMETLMSGIKDAIDDNSASFRKVVIGQVTNTTLTIAEALNSLYSALSAYWTQNNISSRKNKVNFLNNCFITTYTNGGGTTYPEVFCSLYKYSGGGDTFISFGNTGLGLTTNPNSSNSYVGVMMLNDTSSKFRMFGVDHSTDTLSTLTITELTLIYNEVVEGSNALIDQVATLQATVNNIVNNGAKTKYTLIASCTDMTKTMKEALGVLGDYFYVYSSKFYDSDPAKEAILRNKLFIYLGANSNGMPDERVILRYANGGSYYDFYFVGNTYQNNNEISAYIQKRGSSNNSVYKINGTDYSSQTLQQRNINSVLLYSMD